MASTEEEVFGRIGELNLEQLMIVHDEIKLPNIEEGKRVKYSVLNVILKYVSSDTLEQAEDGGLSTCLWIKNLFYGEDVKTEVTTSKGNEVLTKIEGSSLQTPEILNLKKVLKKDFKIRGTIGLPGQKDKLTFYWMSIQQHTARATLQKFTNTLPCLHKITTTNYPRNHQAGNRKP